MFWDDWTLRVGAGEMGGFVKDWLYNRRNDDQPTGEPTDISLSNSNVDENEVTGIVVGVKSGSHRSVRLNLDTPQTISLDIVNTQGIKIATLFNGFLTKGVHRITFPTQSLGKGVYVMLLKGEKIKISKKFIKLEH